MTTLLATAVLAAIPFLLVEAEINHMRRMAREKESQT